ncbi:restriction endonuclease subunit S [Vibrio cyclitrophicus]|uniref:restriction endonuclease subunit S n=1 Tax=Vibrio cyclitrophicus TaxID=47951 RepID=UPI000C81B521|nr:restriction endonuclease subunit S [Vibrio cyclitrophicus]PME43480.1 hypothetical protein BCV36_02760 [Vibrio cyclitrophicus]
MSNWEVKTLGEFLTLQRGYDLTAAQRTLGCVPVMGAGGKNGTHGISKATGPGVVVGRSGSSFGQVYLTEVDFWPHNTSMYVKDFKGNDAYFTYYLLKNLDFNRLNSGSAQPSLNRNFVYPVKVQVPDPREQHSIAAVLRNIDKKIELNNSINAELETMTQTLYDYWFVQFDFPNADGAPYKASGGQMVYDKILKRDIPVDWEVSNLNRIISRSGTGLNPRSNFKLGEGSNYYVTIKSIDNGKIKLDDKCDRISDESLKIINNRSDLKVGDVLFTSIQPVGETYFIQEKPTNWNINESVFTLRANTEQVTPEYLYMLLSSQEMKAYTKQSSTGSIHKGIRHGVLKEFLLPFGGKEITKEFSKVLSPILKKQALIEKENRTLSETRDWLLPMLMNGQVTVK